MATSECSEKWSNVNTCIFIDLYKERPYLWNPKHLQYKNKLIRFDGLTEIGNIMKISVEECEKKIKNLLSQYAREKKKIKKTKSPAQVLVLLKTFGLHMNKCIFFRIGINQCTQGIQEKKRPRVQY